MEDPADHVPWAAEAARSEALAALAATSFERTTLEDDLAELCRILHGAASHLAAVSVTATLDDGSHTTAASTSPAAREVDELEYRLLEGPCVVAMHTGELQLVTDTSEDGRWPRFAAAAADRGFAAVAGIPLVVDGDGVGALNLFAGDTLAPEDVELGQALAGSVAALLANGQAYRRAQRHARRLRQALDELAEVQQAVGVLVVTGGLSTEAAARSLRRRAEREGRGVRDVARDVLRGVAD
ncbi:GAF domain-containing protein [Nitriliruptoraceae bacterium ZYF776]|nr:GAF domain-containing protein [Profundirhabdus halotolerans]